MGRAKYKAAGQYLKGIRVAAGHNSRDSFVKLCGDRASYDRISSLENGCVEPKARDLQIYQQVLGCEASVLLAIPV